MRYENAIAAPSVIPVAATPAIHAPNQRFERGSGSVAGTGFAAAGQTNNVPAIGRRRTSETKAVAASVLLFTTCA